MYVGKSLGDVEEGSWEFGRNVHGALQGAESIDISLTLSMVLVVYRIIVESVGAGPWYDWVRMSRIVGM